MNHGNCYNSECWLERLDATRPCVRGRRTCGRRSGGRWGWVGCVVFGEDADCRRRLSARNHSVLDVAVVSERGSFCPVVFGEVLVEGGADLCDGPRIRLGLLFTARSLCN